MSTTRPPLAARGTRHAAQGRARARSERRRRLERGAAGAGAGAGGAGVPGPGGEACRELPGVSPHHERRRRRLRATSGEADRGWTGRTELGRGGRPRERPPARRLAETSLSQGCLAGDLRRCPFGIECLAGTPGGAGPGRVGVEPSLRALPTSSAAGRGGGLRPAAAAVLQCCSRRGFRRGRGGDSPLRPVRSSPPGPVLSALSGGGGGGIALSARSGPLRPVRSSLPGTGSPARGVGSRRGFRRGRGG